jgi:hypothetical protein
VFDGGEVGKVLQESLEVLSPSDDLSGLWVPFLEVFVDIREGAVEVLPSQRRPVGLDDLPIAFASHVFLLCDGSRALAR